MQGYGSPDLFAAGSGSWMPSDNTRYAPSAPQRVHEGANLRTLRRKKRANMRNPVREWTKEFPSDKLF